MVRGVRAVVSASLAVLVVGCSPALKPPPNSHEAALRIAAASDLQGVLPELIAAYRAESGRLVDPPSFGASGQLAEQVRQGAPFDLFLSANEKYPRTLADEGVVDAGSVAVYARGRLVLVAASGADGVGSLDDLTGPGVVGVAMANPEFAPYGAAAKTALERASLWEALQPKLVRANTVREAFEMVATGNVDAGLVASSVARGSGLRVIDLPDAIAPPLPQALGVVSNRPNAERARDFARFLAGPTGRAILVEHGFALPEARERSD